MEKNVIRLCGVEKRCLPDLMTRFREEHYDTKAWKAAFTPRGTRKEIPLEDNARPCRKEYFTYAPAARKAILKAQKTQRRLDGF